MFAVFTAIEAPGNPIYPIGAVALSQTIGEPTGIIRAVVERGQETSQLPLNGCCLGTRDLFGSVGLAGDGYQHDPRQGEIRLTKGHRDHRRLAKRCTNNLGTQFGMKSFPGPAGFVQGIAEVPGRGMKRPECRFGGFEIDRCDIHDHSAALCQFDNAAEGIGLISIGHR